MASDQEPILASWKISEVLQRYPQALDELVGLSPAFAKLRNPVMRRVQSRLVTVAQAAAIAGLEPAQLTRQLNQAVGITASDTHNQSNSPDEKLSLVAPEWVGTAPVAQELDARPIMARGEEPFRAIMSAARLVPVGSILRLHTGFEPLPLYDALGKLGFAHHARQIDPDHWQVAFLRERATVSEPTSPSAVSGLDWNDTSAAEVTIDVSELVPPEPMIRILEALESLPDEGRLLVHHVRRPIHLYDRLDELGYPHDTRELSPGHVDVLIRKRVAAGEPA